SDPLSLPDALPFWSTNNAEPTLITSRREASRRSALTWRSEVMGSMRRLSATCTVGAAVQPPSSPAHPVAARQPLLQRPPSLPRSAATQHRSAAANRHCAAADERDHLRNAGGALQEQIDVAAAADDLDGALVTVLAEEAAVELPEEGFQLLCAAVSRAQLEQRKLALDVVLAGHIGDVDD